MAIDANKFEEEYHQSTWDKYKLWILLGAGLVILWAVARGSKGFTYVDNTDIAIGILVLSALFIKTGDLVARQHSPVFISDPIASTFTGHKYYIGNWCIIRKGGVAWGVYNYEGRQGSLIFPKTALINQANHAIISCHMRWIPENCIPQTILTRLKQEGHPQPYYIGFTDVRVLQHVPKLNFMQEEFFDAQRHVYFLKGLQQDIMDAKENVSGWKDRLFKKKQTVIRQEG